MKSAAVFIALLFTFSCCTASCGKDEESPTPQNENIQNPNTTTKKMKITIGTAVLTATLYDNPSANAFKAALPLTVNMNELNNNEKYFDLHNNLPTNAIVGGKIKTGDLMLYGSNTLVLFYKNLSTSYSYTRLGAINNPAGLEVALGNGNIAVKFENN